VAVLVGRDGVVVDEVPAAGGDVGHQIGVRERDARVDDGHLGAGLGDEVPGRGHVDVGAERAGAPDRAAVEDRLARVVQRPLLVEQVVVGGGERAARLVGLGVGDAG
jgi:hypothetical protein